MHADRYIKKMNSPPHASNRCDKVQVCFRLLGGVASKTIMQKDPNRRGPTPKELSDALEIEATCLLSMLRETVTEMDSLKDEEQYLHRMTQHYQNQIDTFKQKQAPSS